MAKQQLVWIMMLSGILMAALSRFLPHPPNFTPIAAMALFSGAFLKNKKLSLIVPIGAMLLSDAILEFYKPGYGFHATTPYVYGSLMLITLLGITLQKNRKPGNAFGASLLGTLLFFLITNFGTWLSQSLYPHTGTGLLECYTMGLPFLKYSFTGDLFFNLVLFGGYYILSKRVQVQNA